MGVRFFLGALLLTWSHFIILSHLKGDVNAIHTFVGVAYASPQFFSQR